MQTKRFQLILILTVSTLMFQACSVGKMITKPSSLETIMAVKEVLNSSYFKAFKTLSIEGVDGIIPNEVESVLGTMKSLGLDMDVDSIKQTINRSSSVVYSEGKDVMFDAIKEVDLGDAVAIVVGGEDAATEVLRQAMYTTVKKKYSHQISKELDKNDINTYWPLAAGAYNIFAKNKVDSNLSDFIAERAVDAAFLAMGKQEKNIRKDPGALGKAVVTKVFDYYKNKQG